MRVPTALTQPKIVAHAKVTRVDGTEEIIPISEDQIQFEFIQNDLTQEGDN